MRIELRPVPESPDAVGTLDGEVLTFVGRDAFVGGQPFPQGEIGEALAEAVEEAATALWGSDYLGSLSRVSGLNRRSVVGDRIARNGLPDWLLRILAYGAGHPAPRALGYLMLAAAEVLDATDEHPHADTGALAHQGLEDALALVARARTMKRLPAGTR
ncbi:hypothetical protein [Methylorubrum extorquens]|uniref:hypothetical protein n=1 Tax=Methylorubrum extorquens TaxID=408 RepID=UPI001EE565FC|nr:hypothetical protein [Methylorubrum extorquens]MCG5249523.1 hypothetical protein [Methylorubrum extorquens]